MELKYNLEFQEIILEHGHKHSLACCAIELEINIDSIKQIL